MDLSEGGGLGVQPQKLWGVLLFKVRTEMQDLARVHLCANQSSSRGRGGCNPLEGRLYPII